MLDHAEMEVMLLGQVELEAELLQRWKKGLNIETKHLKKYLFLLLTFLLIPCHERNPSSLAYEINIGKPTDCRVKHSNNRSPKGNMWSAMTVALLFMIVNLCEGEQGSGPEGDEVL